MSEPSFPPLLSGHRVEGNIDPFDRARALAAKGCDAGVIVYRLSADVFRAAIVLAPEVPLADAMAMLPACGIGLQNALGALAPPEVAVHLEWDGGVRVNGAACGGFRIAASTTDPQAVPDWLVVGLTIPLLPEEDDVTPHETALHAEGCAEIDARTLLESWSRHTLAWINGWESDGVEPLHREWNGLLHDLGEEIEMDGMTGTFLGVDERFGMLLRDGGETRLIPLTALLGRPD